MSWELVREVLRRLETKWRANGSEDPTAECRLYADESWTIVVNDDYGHDHVVSNGKGANELSGLLEEIRS